MEEVKAAAAEAQREVPEVKQQKAEASGEESRAAQDRAIEQAAEKALADTGKGAFVSKTA
jgi:hypothetical protein